MDQWKHDLPNAHLVEFCHHSWKSTGETNILNDIVPLNSLIRSGT